MSAAAPRMTIPTRRVLATFLAAPDRERYGLEIGEAADLPSGTVHPILARLEGLGWVTSRWEDVDPRHAGRPVRRYYRLSEHGRAEAQKALARSARSRVSTAPATPTILWA